jgi:hypothetical protein
MGIWYHSLGNVMSCHDNTNPWEHDINVLEIDGYRFQECVLSSMWTLCAHMITCHSYVKMCCSHVDVIGHLDHVMHIHILWNSNPWNIDIQGAFCVNVWTLHSHKIMMGCSHLGIWGSWNGEWHYHTHTITKSISIIIMNILKHPSIIGFFGW